MLSKLPLSVERIIRRVWPGKSKADVGLRSRSRKQALAALNGDAAMLQNLRDWSNFDEVAEIVADVERILADRAKAAARNAELRAAIDNGCPTCGTPMRQNLSLTGWWQCGQFGAEGFRKDSSKPSCSYQGFIVEVD